MKLKDLFQSTKTLKSSSLDDMAAEVESHGYIESFNKERARFLPNVDYSIPDNFAFFGSAEKYYTDSFDRIRGMYPYDGSEKEKYDWLNESTFIDLYVFEEKYPRYNGYVNLGYPNWGTRSGSLIDGYGKSDTDTFIKTFGGPHRSDKTGLPKQHAHANKYDSSKTRESNLKFKLQDGVSIEMWLKKPAFDTTKTEKEVLFDLWNGEASGSAQYGRLRLELTGASSGSPFLLTAMSGATGFQNQTIGTSLTTGSITDWTHVAVTAKSSGSATALNLYINGTLNQTTSVASINLGEVTGSLISYMGALQTPPSGSPTIQAGAGKFSGSMDEFRYWKTERSSKEIGRNYWTHIGGGTNNDASNTNLGVYYKFNEGITAVASYDSSILDYSGRLSNGAWTGYQSGARNTSSAMVLAGATSREFKDPTIYSVDPGYVSTLTELEDLGRYYDTNNNSYLFHGIPAWILDEDNEKDGNLRNLTQIMGSYFDNLHLHIAELNSLKDVYSHFQSPTIDIIGTSGELSTTGSVKPLPFADRLLTNAGFVAPELFADATVLEALATRSEDENYELKLHNVKNQIYQNVYSSLTNIYKQKGTNRAFRNLLHAFGIDEDVVKINFYGNNVDFELKDRYSIRATKEKFVDFNHPDRFVASVYQQNSGSNGSSFISGSTGDFEKFIPVTFETQVILPNKIPWNEVGGFNTPFTKSVITGIHAANPAAPSDYTIPGTDLCGLQIYSERDAIESKRVKFHLSSSALGVNLSSSYYDNMYTNNEWQLAFRLRNDRHPNTDVILSSSLTSNYTLDFIGYSTTDSTIIESFHHSASIPAAKAHNFLNTSKRLYVGAKRENFTGSLVERSDHKIGFVRYWMNFLDKDTILKHSYDSNNYGAKNPLRSTFLFEDSNNDLKVPEIDTLLLEWDFQTLSTSNTSGQFSVIDASSGSGVARYTPAFETVKRKFYHGKGDFFLANDAKAIDVEYITAARSTYPEILQGDDMIEIRTQDDTQFTKNTLPQDYYIAFEKSMAQTVSEEMIRFMSSVTAFNDLIGRPVDRYRMEYKDLTKLRQLFFERVSNEPDLDKYTDYYKWLDDALGEMLVELVPASLAHSDGINNVIENYVLARDKYFNKFPTIEFKAPTPIGGMNTINRHLYPWKTGHAPVEQPSATENQDCFWWLERAERDQPPLSGSASGSNNSRVKIFQARNSVLNRSYTTAQHFAVDRSRHLHGGTNYEDNKKRDYIWSATKQVSESPATYGQYGTFPLRYVLSNNDMFETLKDCNDERPVTEKIKIAFTAVDGFASFHHYMSGNLHDGTFKGGMVMPFNLMSSSVNTGYSDLVAGIPGAGNNVDIVNVHSDTVDNTNAVPLQGPFTERWVGGHQHRHAPLNRGTDVEATRPEGYKILVKSILNSSGSIGIAGADYPYPHANQLTAPFFRFDQAKARYYREERAKRPLNIRNIQTSGSQVGNYNRTYQFVHTSGRTANKTGFKNILPTTNIHNATNTLLPATNVEASLIARGIGQGNTMSNFATSSLYLGDVKTTTAPLVEGTSDSVIASKFSAPGSYETMSDSFLDMYAREKSVYNALPFRNLNVRGVGAGEANTFRITDIHGNRWGLRTHLTRHSAQHGIDSVVGGTSPAFHKINRNSKWDPSESSYDHDNYWVQHQIPQTDYQYKWVKSTHTASLATSSLNRHILSGFTEPSGTTSRFPHEYINYTAHSQSAINQRRNGLTAYGYPSWEQIRNTDRTANTILRKSYGYSTLSHTVMDNRAPSGTIIDNVSTIEESRVVLNIPNVLNLAFKGSEFEFKYPYVNMKYHFDNDSFNVQGLNPSNNETMYESLLGYYGKESEESFSPIKVNVRQIVYPMHTKHTKYSTRHRHYFASHYWTDGENTAYNSNLSETGSYLRLDEAGRRETNVTASLFGSKSLNSQTQQFVNNGKLTNIIPSQSIWSMDARTNYASSNPSTAASNSSGAPGVLQNQDHHFHNDISDVQLLSSGSAATGSFTMKGATRFGTAASGSFTVQGMQPTGVAATGSFEISGANAQGTQGTGTFTALPAFTAAVSSSVQFDATTSTILGAKSAARFVTTGAQFLGSAASSSFTLNDIPQGGDSSHLIFDLAYQTLADGHKLKIGRNSDTDYLEVQLDGTGSVAGTNTALPIPLDFQKAASVSGSARQMSTAITTLTSQDQEEFILSGWFKIPTASLEHNMSKHLYYQQKSSGNPTVELYFNAGSTTAEQHTLIFKSHHTRDSDSIAGYRGMKWVNLATAEDDFHADSNTNDAKWVNISLFYQDRGVSEAPLISLKINGNNVAGAAQSLNIGSSYTHVNQASSHYVLGSSVAAGSEWSSGHHIKISDLQIWKSGSIATSPSDTAAFENRATDIMSKVYPNFAGIFAPDYAVSSSYAIAKYQFGDNGSDVARAGSDRITDVNTSTTNHLDLAFDFPNQVFVSSSFANKKYTGASQASTWFAAVKTIIESDNTNQNYFSVTTHEYSVVADGNHATNWYHQDGDAVASRGFQPKIQSSDDSITGQITSGVTMLDYCRFYVSALTPSAASLYTLNPTENNASATGQSKSFNIISQLSAGSAAVGTATNLHDSTITINGSTIGIGHHEASSQANRISTFVAANSAYAVSCVDGNSTKLTSQAYSSSEASFGKASADISFSFWYSRADDTGSHYILTMDETGYTNNIRIYSTSSYLYMRIYAAGAASYTSFKIQWSTIATSHHIDKNSLNHFVLSYDTSSDSEVIYINGIAFTPIVTLYNGGCGNNGRATSFDELQLLSYNDSTNSTCVGRLSNVALWDIKLSAADALEMYHCGRAKQLLRHSKVANLVHWYLLDDITASNLGAMSTIPDSAPRPYSAALAISQGSNINSVADGGVPTDVLSAAAFRTALDSAIDTNVSNYTAAHTNGAFTITYGSIGIAGNGDTTTTTSDIFSSIVTPTAGGLAPSGSSDGDTLTIDADVFTLDDDGNSGTHIVAINGVSSQTFWNNLSASIKAQTNFTEINIDGTGDTRTFNLTASADGSGNNVSLSETGDSFTSILNATGGVTESGAADYDDAAHYINFHAITGNSSHLYKIRADKDNTHTSGNPFQAEADGSSTILWIDSTQSDADWWDAIEDALEAEGFTVSQDSSTPRRFTVTNYTAGVAGNGTGAAGNGSTSGATFAFVSGGKFAGGSGATGAAAGDTITIHGQSIEVIHGSSPGTRQVRADGVSDNAFWSAIESEIDSNVSDVTAAQGSDSPRTFTVTTVATGSAANPTLSAETGDTFVITAAGTNGTDEAGAENGDTITIDGSTFAINLSSGLGTGSSGNFHTALKNEIIAATVFDTIVVDNESAGYYKFNLTSSATGTAENVTFSQNTNGSRATFRNLAGAAGGTSPIGIQDLDRIKISDTQDSNPDNTYVFFNVDLNGDETSSNTIRFIDISTITGTDSEKSTKFWNALSASIKTHTAFDSITISDNANTATFHVTSSNTGSAYNDDIEQVYQSPGDDGTPGFVMINQIAGGTNPSGASIGDTIDIKGTTFTIVHNSSPTALQINASGVTDTAFFNAMSSAVKTNTDYDLITYINNSDTGSFSVTSSNGTPDAFTGEAFLTGTAYNYTMAQTGNSTFSVTSVLQGGTNGTFRNIKFSEIIPQPRYNYPHAIPSPGSLRAPSAKSNLGLINSSYKLRSNHFNLTRSLGYATDGLYDNTSRWLTPDLSTFKPFDNDYNEWYENLRGHNKHYALVPEFRISSHIKDIVKTGTNERAYFSKNYWLELTGTSLDNGANIGTNKLPPTSAEAFLQEHAVSTTIRNIDGFIEDNTSEAIIPHKLTLTCDAIMSFLPYEGFYPQTRTVELCEAFAESYGKHIVASEADPAETDMEFPENNVMAQSRPIFDTIMSPGLLYNTIKSGIAVDYPIISSKMTTASLADPYGGVNHMIKNEYFDNRLPFETLLSPLTHLGQKPIVDANPHPSSSFNLKAELQGESDINYRLMANNFFAETIEFFLEGGKTSRIISKPDTDPSFGVVIQNHTGRLPVYRSIFKVFKSKKAHPYIEFSGSEDITAISTTAKDRYHNRPPSGTNYFLNEYAEKTGSALEYDIDKVRYPRPQFNPYAEVETMTMYSQPNAFGPPCAGGVAVEFGSVDGVDSKGTGENNTTYMMYDSTNGYNAPFTPPYYDGEAWAIYTFTPEKSGKHTLDEILANTSVEYLRYELNHESGSFGDRGTFGPQGLSINENAMQIDASFNMFRQVQVMPVTFDNVGRAVRVDSDPNKIGKAWVIESKFETPILDFSKYLNREYNAEFEADVTTSDIFTGSLSLSGTRTEPDTLGAVHTSLSSVHQLKGILNPIGMWHQHGEFPASDDKGIFMQIVDVPTEYTLLGTEMTIPNPKYAVVKPEINDCDGTSLNNAYNKQASKSLTPYFSKQEMRRKIVGTDEFAVNGSALQIINKDNGIILDAELKLADVTAAYGSLATAALSSGIFTIFTGSTKTVLTTHADFTSSATTYSIFLNGTASAAPEYSKASSGSYQGHWAAGYYNYDRAGDYTPLLIQTKEYDSLKYDYNEFSRGPFEDFLKEFSIGIGYTKQSRDFSDGEQVACLSSTTPGVSSVLLPAHLKFAIESKSLSPTMATMSELDMSDSSKSEMMGVNQALSKKKVIGTYKALANPVLSRKFRLIPPSPTPSSTPTAAQTSSYGYPEPTFIRASIRYNAGASSSITFKDMVPFAPQNDRNFASNPSTVRWGQFMHTQGATALTQSLADLVGFNQEKVKMGVTATKKLIREAVIAIPYIVGDTGERNFLRLDSEQVNRFLFEHNLIDEDRNASSGMVAVQIGTTPSPQDEQPEQLVDIAVRTQIAKMQRYNLPPHLDFIENDINPLVMYIFEFTKELDREDLNNLWQGVRSENLKSVDFSEKSITHTLDNNSMLASIKEITPDMSALKDLKWMIFKAKQKGKSNYNQKMTEDLSDGRFNFNQENSSDNLGHLSFGYNWPYDYFSLVENVKISADIEFKKFVMSEGLDATPQPSGIPQNQIEIGSMTSEESPFTQETATYAVTSQTPTPETMEQVSTTYHTAPRSTSLADVIVSHDGDDRSDDGGVLDGSTDEVITEPDTTTTTDTEY